MHSEAIMKEADITKALTAHLSAAALGYEIVWQDEKVEQVDLAPPYLDIEHVRTLRPTVNVKGGQRSEGYLQVTSVGQKGEFATPTEGVADEVSDVFPIGQRIVATGGAITVLESRVLSGFPDDVHWRVPVRITYRAIPN